MPKVRDEYYHDDKKTNMGRDIFSRRSKRMIKELRAGKNLINHPKMTAMQRDED